MKMRIRIATAVLSAFATASIAMLVSQSAHAEYCATFHGYKHNHGAPFCIEADKACRRELGAEATARYGFWRMVRYESHYNTGYECRSHTTVICSAYICQDTPPKQAHPKLNPSAPFPRGAIPPTTQAHPPLNPIAPPGWPGVHVGPHMPK
jgi:hypothetical protein